MSGASCLRKIHASEERQIVGEGTHLNSGAKALPRAVKYSREAKDSLQEGNRSLDAGSEIS